MYTRIFFAVFYVAVLIHYGCDPAGEDTVAEERPNVLLIMTDDQGYGDIGYHGNPVIKTPNLDALAAKSTRLNDFYVAPVCAPTRASLMTGRHFIRTGVYDTYNGGAIMAGSELTVAELFRDKGYKTGVFGKWHLGDAPPSRPVDQGFDESLVHGGGGIGQPGDVLNYYAFDSSYFDPVLHHNGEPLQTEGYCSDVYTDHAIDFIRNRGETSFFVYLAFNAPHTPLQLPEKYFEMYKDVDVGPAAFDTTGIPFPEMSERDMDDARRVYGMVTNIDDNVGRLMATLESEGILDNTVVVFLTDNGPQQRRYTAGLRARKGSVYEGGIRVPCYIHYPDGLPIDRDVYGPAAHVDILPTLLDLCDIAYPDHERLDGISVVPLIGGERTEFDKRPLYWHWQRGYPERYRNMAIRLGDYKLVGHTDFRAEVGALELYNLAEDPFEQNNLVETERDVAQALKAELDTWYNGVIANENTLSPPRIEIGSVPGPVQLNRNDARGMPGIWRQREIYGYWDITVVESGSYDVRCVFLEELPVGGQLMIRCAPFQYTISPDGVEGKEVYAEALRLDSGDYMLECRYSAEGFQAFPFYIEVERADKK
jgi:arylsulfatase